LALRRCSDTSNPLEGCPSHVAASPVVFFQLCVGLLVNQRGVLTVIPQEEAWQSPAAVQKEAKIKRVILQGEAGIHPVMRQGQSNQFAKGNADQSSHPTRVSIATACASSMPEGGPQASDRPQRESTEFMHCLLMPSHIAQASGKSRREITQGSRCLSFLLEKAQTFDDSERGCAQTDSKQCALLPSI
jgi:hypothetical protein